MLTNAILNFGANHNKAQNKGTNANHGMAIAQIDGAHHESGDKYGAKSPRSDGTSVKRLTAKTACVNPRPIHCRIVVFCFSAIGWALSQQN